MNKRVLVTSVLVSLVLLLVSMWQIEIIWISQQNGWVYGLPFDNYSHGLWFWHDLWFTLICVSWVLVALPSIVLISKRL